MQANAATSNQHSVPPMYSVVDERFNIRLGMCNTLLKYTIINLKLLLLYFVNAVRTSTSR